MFGKILKTLCVFHFFCFDVIGQENFNFKKIFNNEIQRDYSQGISSYNVASLAFKDEVCVSLLFHNGFLLKELIDKSVDFYASHKGNLVALHLSHTGFSKMGEMTLACGYGRNFGHCFAAALRFFYLCSYARNYQPVHSFTLDFSLSATLSERCLLSVSAYNPIRMKYGVTGSEVIPVVVNIDMAYALSQKLLLSMSLQKNFPGSFQVSMSGGVALSRFLAVALTCALPQPSLTLLCRLRWRHLSFHFSSSYLFPLGVSLQCGLSYVF